MGLHGRLPQSHRTGCRSAAWPAERAAARCQAVRRIGCGRSAVTGRQRQQSREQQSAVGAAAGAAIDSGGRACAVIGADEWRRLAVLLVICISSAEAARVYCGDI